MTKAAKKDKQAKTDLAIKIQQMENELQKRHDTEEAACTTTAEEDTSEVCFWLLVVLFTDWCAAKNSGNSNSKSLTCS